MGRAKQSAGRAATARITRSAASRPIWAQQVRAVGKQVGNGAARSWQDRRRRRVYADRVGKAAPRGTQDTEPGHASRIEQGRARASASSTSGRSRAARDRGAEGNCRIAKSLRDRCEGCGRGPAQRCDKLVLCAGSVHAVNVAADEGENLIGLRLVKDRAAGRLAEICAETELLALAAFAERNSSERSKMVAGSNSIVARGLSGREFTPLPSSAAKI